PRSRKHTRLVADRPGNGSRVWATKSPSSRTSADPHARIFGLSLAALLAAGLVLNASTLICQESGRDFRTPEGVSHVEPFGTIRSKECATNAGGEEPGY